MRSKLQKISKKIGLSLLALTGPVVFLIATNYFASQYIAEYFFKYLSLPVRLSETVDHHLFWRLGYITDESRHHFFEKEVLKKNVIRIGLFGDSFTYGDEVQKGSDLASLLQEQLGHEYEVINFSANWYSLSQSYILFQELHQKYDLDICLLGPRNYQKDRLLRFNHTNHVKPDYIHSRHIIKDDELHELKPYGLSAKERVWYYYQAIPKWNYLHYDLSAPGFLKFLEHKYSRAFKNIFYYSSDENEHEKIIAKMIKDMKAQSPRLIVLNDEHDIKLDDMKKYFDTNDHHVFYKIPNFSKKGLLFEAPGSHYTILGNLALSQIVANIILNQDEPDQDYSFNIKNPIVPFILDENTAPQLLKNTTLTLNLSIVGTLDTYNDRYETGDPQSEDKQLALNYYGIEQGIGFLCGQAPSIESFILAITKKEYENLLPHLKGKLYQFSGVNSILYYPIEGCLYDNPGNAILVPQEHESLTENNGEYFFRVSDQTLLKGRSLVFIGDKSYARMKPEFYSLKFRIVENLPIALRTLKFNQPLDIEVTSF